MGRRRGEAATAREREPKSASRTWVKFEIGRPRPQFLSLSRRRWMGPPSLSPSLRLSCVLSRVRSTAVHLSRVLARPRPPTPPPRPFPLFASPAELSPSSREYSYRAPEIGEENYVEREGGLPAIKQRTALGQPGQESRQVAETQTPSEGNLNDTDTFL